MADENNGPDPEGEPEGDNMSALEKAAIKEKQIRELSVKILGGFFVYRANPSESEPLSKLVGQEGSSTGKDFAQMGEVTGMVLIKQYGTRKFMAYEPIDPATFKFEGKIMTYFSEKTPDNKYDHNATNVFDLETLDALVKRMIVQKL